MKLNPKVTGALAWTGLVLVLAVPAADMLGAKPDAAVHLTSDTAQLDATSSAPVVPRPVTPAPTADRVAALPATGNDAVTDFVKSGRPLPSYISDAPAVAPVTAPVAAKPATSKPGTVTINPDGTISRPTQTATVKPAAPVGIKPVLPADQTANVATIKPELVPPVPLPASLRPTPRPAGQSPLIIDEQQVAVREPADSIYLPEAAPVVTGDQLEEWDSGSLAEYLRRKGLIEEGASSATVQDRNDYDPDGFFLDEGPNRPSRSRVIIVDRSDSYFW